MNTIALAQIGTVVQAVDFSQGRIDRVGEKVRAENIRFSASDPSMQWPWKDGVYDLIVCDLVLEHFENLYHIIAEAARTLVLNGRCLINELHPFKQYHGIKAGFERARNPSRCRHAFITLRIF